MANALSAVYKYAIPLAVGISFAQASIYDVKGGTRAVIFDRLSGVREQVVNEGTHFLIPWLQKSIIYDVRTKPRNIATTTGSKDLQMVSLTLRVLHRPDVKMLPKIYQVCSPLDVVRGYAISSPGQKNGDADEAFDSHSAKTMMNECYPRSATRC